MAYHESAHIPRNWKIVCTEGNEEIEIAKEENNTALCPSFQSGQTCGSSDKKAFHLQHSMNCSKIRFYGYKTSSSGNYIAMSGFELFGRILMKTNLLEYRSCRPRNQQQLKTFIYVIVVASWWIITKVLLITLYTIILEDRILLIEFVEIRIRHVLMQAELHIIRRIVAVSSV